MSGDGRISQPAAGLSGCRNRILLSDDEIRYRLRLAEGFLKEARQDSGLGRWRSCALPVPRFSTPRPSVARHLYCR
jgi:hypothetical protein